MSRDAIFKAVVSVAVLYVLIAGLAGIALKAHYPPLNTCKQVSYGWFDTYCPGIDTVTAPAMAVLGPPAYVVQFVRRRAIYPAYDGAVVPIAVFLSLPLILLVYICALIWYPTHRVIALVVPFLIAVEAVWDGFVGIAGIT